MHNIIFISITRVFVKQLSSAVKKYLTLLVKECIKFYRKEGEFMQPVNINGSTFESYPLNTSFNDVPGVYVIYTSQRWLDVGETDKLGQRIPSHERRDGWMNNASGLPINIAFLRIESQSRRLSIESNLRNSLNPICGSR